MPDKTSRQRFEAHLAETETDYLTKAEANNAFIFWQAAERDMLERCVYEAEQGFRRALDGNEIADKLKEILNEH
jgi:hypothetical protein